MANVGVTFDFAAESAKLRSEIDKVRREVSGLSATAKGVEKAFKTLGGVVLGAFSVSAITGFLSKVNAATNQLADLSTRLSASASGLQVLQVAAQQAGGSAEGMNTALGKMSATIGDALGGNKAAAAAFQRLGLSLGEIAGLKADEAVRRISGALADVDNTYQRASLAQDIFGKGAKDIAGVLAGGTAAIDETNRALAEQGALLDDLDVAKIDAMNDALAFQGTVVTNLGAKFLSNLSPAVGVAVDSVGNLIGNLGGATEAGKGFGVVLTAGIKIVEAAVYSLGAVFEGLRSLISGALSTIMRAVERLVAGLAFVAEQLGAPLAKPLAQARDVLDGIAVSLYSVSLASEANAKAAGAAALKAAADVFRAGQIFDEFSRDLDVKAAAAAARAQASQGALGGGLVPGAAGAAAGGQQPGALLSDQTLFATTEATRFDPALDPKVLQQVQINEALQALEDQHAATMMGKLETFNATWLGQMLMAGQTQIAAEQSKNIIIGQSMGQLAGIMMNQGGRIGKAGKALAIAQTVWATASAAMQSFQNAGGYPWGIAPAAAVVATGLAQLTNIKKTIVGGGGSVVSATGAQQESNSGG